MDDPVTLALDTLRTLGWEAGARRLRAEGTDRAGAALVHLAGFEAAERGDFARALAVFEAQAADPRLAAWATVGRALVALRRRDPVPPLEGIAADRSDPTRAAVADHLRGLAAFHAKDRERARSLLLGALERLGPTHPLAGRVLDTLGAVYAERDNLLAAVALYRQALAAKAAVGDDAGLALTHGQLGRLFLDWEVLDDAEREFRADLALALRAGDRLGEAKMHGDLGQVALLRARDAAAAGADPGPAIADATAALDRAIALADAHGFTLLGAFARKDRAAVAVATGSLAAATARLAEARTAFAAQDFRDGLAHVGRVEGLLARAAGDPERSVAHLAEAAAWFASRDAAAEAARCLLELARSQAAAGGDPRAPTTTLMTALAHAERCRHERLVLAVEAELERVDPVRYWRHAYARARGRTLDARTTSLVTGTRETASVLYLDIQGSTAFALGRAPEEVLATLNQMMTETASALRNAGGTVAGFRGDGFLATFRGDGHAERAVRAALALFDALDEFNEPRRVLQAPVFRSRIGIATGELCFGNVGTYDKVDYTCIGTPANLGARLEAAGEPGRPCICAETHAAVAHAFEFAPGNPRTRVLKGLGDAPIPMWDVVGPRPAATATP